MKRYYIMELTLILVSLFIFGGCTHDNTIRKDQNEGMVNGTVYLNEHIITDFTAFISSTDARLPFVETVKLLGMVVEIKKDGNVQIVSNNDIYILQCFPDVSLVKQGNYDENLMLPPPGSTSYYCQYELGDVFLDDCTMASTLSLMGITAYIDVDYVTSKILITTFIK